MPRATFWLIRVNKMKCRTIVNAFILICCALLAGCNEIDKNELLTNVQGLTSPDAIVAAIGEANTKTGDGAMTIWRYETNADDVCFMAAGNLVLRNRCL